jgi:hypothetical protein
MQVEIEVMSGSYRTKWRDTSQYRIDVMPIIPTSNRAPDGFETLAQARDRRAYKITVLSGGNERQGRLAAKLKRCRRGNRCNSGACDVCARFFRLRLLQQLQPILASRPRWTRASVVPADFLFAPGELANVDLNALRKKISKRFERWSLQNRIVIAGIDISFNTEDNDTIGWQLHLYMLIEGEHTPRLEEAVKATFPPEPTARVPYTFTQVAGKLKAITYLYKSIFLRRSRYTVFERRPRTRNLPLKRSELRELLEFLGKYPVGARLILRGLRRDGSYLIITNKNQRLTR